MTSIQTIKAEIANLNNLARAHNRSHNDGGDGYNPYAAKIDAALDDLRAATLADYVSRWVSIKAAWNSAVAKYTTGNKIDMRDLAKIEAAAGITLSDVTAVKSMVEG